MVIPAAQPDGPPPPAAKKTVKFDADPLATKERSKKVSDVLLNIARVMVEGRTIDGIINDAHEKFKNGDILDLNQHLGLCRQPEGKMSSAEMASRLILRSIQYAYATHTNKKVDPDFLLQGNDMVDILTVSLPSILKRNGNQLTNEALQEIFAWAADYQIIPHDMVITSASLDACAITGQSLEDAVTAFGQNDTVAIRNLIQGIKALYPQMFERGTTEDVTLAEVAHFGNVYNAYECDDLNPKTLVVLLHDFLLVIASTSGH